jgi:hypothetical protein
MLSPHFMFFLDSGFPRALHLSQMAPCSSEVRAICHRWSLARAIHVAPRHLSEMVPLEEPALYVFFLDGVISEGAPSVSDGALVLPKCAPSVSDGPSCEPCMWLLAISLRWPLSRSPHFVFCIFRGWRHF